MSLLLIDSHTVEALQTESGMILESSLVTEFRNGVLAGKWELVERLLLELPSEAISDLSVSHFLFQFIFPSHH